MNCYNDWADDFMNRAIDSISGRLHEPITLSEENAWKKIIKRITATIPIISSYFFWRNMATDREIQITEEEFNNQSQPNL